jgi:biopolymer transport protein ExbB
MLELLRAGGPMMVPLAACAVVAAATVVLSLRDLGRARIEDPPGLAPLLDLARAGELGRAIEAFRSRPGTLAAVLAAGLEALRHAGEPGRLPAAVGQAGRLEAAHLGRRLGVLKTISRIGPLIGLLGTILGLIGVLQAASRGVAATPAGLLAGVGTTLVASLSGVGMAIAALVAQHVLRKQIDSLVARQERLSLQLLQPLRSD